VIQSAAEAVVLFAYCTTYGIAGILTVSQMLLDWLLGWAAETQ
jgi:hypothetical protein